MAAAGVSKFLASSSDPWISWSWITSHTDQIWAATRQQIQLTVLAIAIGLLISFPLALLARRLRWTEKPILSGAGVLYTIPSLALFALLVPWTGLSVTTAEIGLVSYTLLILVRNIVAGLDGVPPDVREAARGMGFSRRRQLWLVELPLATPSIMAGLRIATVTTIGLVTVTAFIGQGGLGQLILDGLQRDFRTPLVVGGTLCVLMALVADFGLVGLERLLTPWSRRRSGESRPGGGSIRHRRGRLPRKADAA